MGTVQVQITIFGLCKNQRLKSVVPAVLSSANYSPFTTGKPVQITVSAIARDIGQLANIQKHLDRLPLTAQVLAEVVENREEFAVRRDWWSAECFRQEHISPQEWQLFRRANLRPELVAVPQVKEAINSALEAIQIY